MGTTATGLLASRVVLLLVLVMLTLGAARERAASRRLRESGDGLAHYDRPVLVRSFDGSAADHAVRNPVRASRRAGAPIAGTEDGQRSRESWTKARMVSPTSSSCAAGLSFTTATSSRRRT